jgi:phosphoesterase RecJ-like protein
VESFVDYLPRAGAIILTGHEHPDGDCLGSQIGLYHLLRGLGHEVRILLPDAPIRSLEFLCRTTPVAIHESGAELPPCDTLVLVDCAELGRLGALRDAVIRRRPRIAVVDHHVGSDRADGSIGFVDVEAAASGELVWRLYRELGRRPDAVAAEALYCALVADTGWFRYSNTDAKVFTIAADLVACGADPAAIYDRLYRCQPAQSLGILAEGIGRSEIELDGRVGFVAISHGLLERAARVGFDLDQVMEPLRSVGGIEVVVMLKELASDRVKVSLRASGEIDVQRIAKVFGGGGHKKAAGVTLELPMAESRARIRSAIAAALTARESASGLS